jgi:hypothetical protein
LQLYGFKRVTGSTLDYNGYYHEYFLRYRPHLLPFIARTRTNGIGVRQKTDLESEPDFYKMPFLTPTFPGPTNNEGASLSSSPAGQAKSRNPRSRGPRTAKKPASKQEPPAQLQPNHPHDLLMHQSKSAPIAGEKRKSVPTASRGRRGGKAPPISSSGETSTTGSTSSLSLNVLISGAFPGQAALEPRPLPPVYVRQGEEIHQIDSALSVANRPDFRQIDANTFQFTDTQGQAERPQAITRPPYSDYRPHH